MLPKFRTVAEAIAEVGRYYPEHDMVFQDLAGKEARYTFVDVERETAVRAAGLFALGLAKGDRIGMVVVEPEDFVLTFLAALRCGIVPVPLYPPMSFASLDAYHERTAKVLASAEARFVFASARLQNVLWSLVDAVPSLERLLPIESLRGLTARCTLPEIVPADVAFLQYTSGSTADPKGVIVTQGSLVANSEGIIVECLRLDPEKNEKGIHWLPLYHDMGLIGFVIAPLVRGCSSVHIPTMRFIKKPSVWMEAMHRHRGTATFAPNFAYALALKKVSDADLDSWDLSCLRILGCGAEPIHPDTMRDFATLFATRSKLPPNAILPAYGMAEATLAIALKRCDDFMRTQVVDAETFQASGAVRAPIEGKAASEFVSCGRPFAGHAVTAFDEAGNALPEGREGELWHKGPSVAAGYFRNPTATAETFRADGWLRTGDLGFVLDGEVYVTGRLKDLIILNGRNIHPQAVEWEVADVEGVRKGNVVAFSVPSEASEQMIVVLETREGADPAVVASAVRSRVQKELGITVADVVCIGAGDLPKTSSGKLQRRKTRQQYLDAALGHEGSRTFGATASRVTLARHVAKSLWSRAKAAVL
ncbi:MAG: fatty acyl-AMP ligase [Deltaproteobacteria bacterium]|nr:fatty acyl-AMP ligase [Deltaproteobacteria bacterium]